MSGGVLSRSILSVLAPRSLSFTVSQCASVSEAVDRMAEKGVGSLVVTEKNSTDASGRTGTREGEGATTVVGIFTERDYLMKMRGKCCDSTSVRDVMTSHVRSVPTGTSVAECMEVRTTYIYTHALFILKRHIQRKTEAYTDTHTHTQRSY